MIKTIIDFGKSDHRITNKWGIENISVFTHQHVIKCSDGKRFFRTVDVAKEYGVSQKVIIGAISTGQAVKGLRFKRSKLI